MDINNANKSGIFHTALVYFFLVITIIQANSVYMYTEGLIHIGQIIVNILWVISLCSLIVYSLKGLEKNINIKLVNFLFTFLLMGFILIIYNLLFKSSVGLYVPQIIIASVLLILYFYSIGSYRISRLFIKFENIILCLSIISIVSWIMFIIHVPTNFNVLSKWGSENDPRMEMSYFGLSFFTTKTAKFLGMNWISNNGVFSEPSMFAYILLIALLIELFIRNNSQIINLRVIFLLITIISTDSTTGILVAIPTIIYHALVINNRNNIFKYMIIILIPIIFIFLKIILNDKINEGNAGTEINISSSFNVRLDDIVSGFKTWMEHPILGCGLTNYTPIRDNMNPLRITPLTPYPGSSSGLFVILAQGGLLLGMYYLMPTFLAIKKHCGGISIPLLIAFIFTSSQKFYIYIMILMYLWFIILKNNENTSNIS